VNRCWKIADEVCDFPYPVQIRAAALFFLFFF